MNGELSIGEIINPFDEGKLLDDIYLRVSSIKGNEVKAVVIDGAQPKWPNGLTVKYTKEQLNKDFKIAD